MLGGFQHYQLQWFVWRAEEVTNTSWSYTRYSLDWIFFHVNPMEWVWAQRQTHLTHTGLVICVEHLTLRDCRKKCNTRCKLMLWSEILFSSLVAFSCNAHAGHKPVKPNAWFRLRDVEPLVKQRFWSVSHSSASSEDESQR